MNLTGMDRDADLLQRLQTALLDVLSTISNDNDGVIGLMPSDSPAANSPPRDSDAELCPVCELLSQDSVGNADMNVSDGMNYELQMTRLCIS